MAKTFDEVVAGQLSRDLAVASLRVKGYAPKRELTRKTWNKLKMTNDIASIYRLEEQYGRGNVADWAKKNQLKDALEANSESV